MYWDATVAESRMAERLSGLVGNQAASFALGCVQHLLERFFEPPGRREPVYLREERARLGVCWRALREPQAASELADTRMLEALIPANQPSALGQADLVVATLLASESVRRRDTTAAFDAGAYSHQAVCDLNLSIHEIPRDESEFEAAEKASRDCMEMLAFQLGYLTALEAQEDHAPHYESVVAAMNRDASHGT